jgi:hypothetical protein
MHFQENRGSALASSAPTEAAAIDLSESDPSTGICDEPHRSRQTDKAAMRMVKIAQTCLGAPWAAR